MLNGRDFRLSWTEVRSLIFLYMPHVTFVLFWITMFLRVNNMFKGRETRSLRSNSVLWISWKRNVYCREMVTEMGSWWRRYVYCSIEQWWPGWVLDSSPQVFKGLSLKRGNRGKFKFYRNRKHILYYFVLPHHFNMFHL